MVWLAVVLLAQGPDLDREIQLHSRGQSLPTLLKVISNDAGVPVTATGSLARNTVVVRLDPQPVRKILDQLGKALTCSWRVVDGKRVELYRTQAQTDQLKKIERDLRSAELKKSIAALELEEFSKAYAETLAQRARNLEPRIPTNQRDPAVGAEVQALIAAMPSGRGLTRVARSLPVDRLLQMPAQDRVAFAYPANPQQVALPNGKGILDAFNSERSTMFEVLREDLVREREFILSLDSRASQFRLTSPAVKVIAGVNRGPEFRGFYVTVRFVNSEGWTVAELSRTLSDEAKADAPELDDVVAEVSEESYRLNEELSLRGLGPTRDTLLPILANPLRNEPLSWYQGGLLFDHSERAKQPLVAVLTDRSLRRLWLSQTEPGRTAAGNQLASRLAKEWTLNSKVEGGIWYVRPQEQLAAEREYLDRDLMVKTWTSVLKEKRYLIPEAAAYNANAKSELLGTFAELCFVTALAHPYSGNSVDEWLTVHPNAAILRFVGRVPAAMLEPEGRATAVGELPATARDALDRWLLRSAYGSSLGETSDADHPFDHIMHWEPTEALPRGVPQDTQVRFRWITSYFVLQRNHGFPFAAHFAEHAYYFLQWNGDAANFDSATGRALQVEIMFADGRRISSVLRETPDTMAGERNWRRLSELPNSVLEIMRAEARRQEALGNRQQSRNVPP
jgi:hypothetical protein